MEIEFEEVRVRVPKAVMDLLRTFKGDDLQEYLTYTIVQDVASALSSDCHYGEIVSFEAIMEKFNLKPIFEAFDCKMYMPKDC